VAWLGRFDQLLLPAVVLGELYYGAQNGKRVAENIQRLQALISRCQIVEVDGAAAEIYGRVRLELKRAGTPIPENDLWIAATCLAKNISLATRDAHFSAVTGLRAEQP
jgi:tRNA(fMet)-specific endonuclease VapC